MNALVYALQLLQLVRMALGAGIAADPYLDAGEAVLNAAAAAGRDITDDEILALDAQRHSLEQQIRDAANG
jgi:hypothetical protein